MKRTMRWMCAGLLTLALGSTVTAATFENIGSYSSWPTQWTVIPGVNDPDNGVAEELDFVGDSSDAGGYWAKNDDYLFIRSRVDIGTLASNTYRGSTFVCINVLGENMNPSTGNLVTGTDDGLSDYAFAWDSKSNDDSAHGLEMLIRASTGTPAWSSFTFDDIDGSAGQKLANDINGSGRTTDGYVRTIDSQSTTNFGTTSFIDYAVSFSYLETYTDLDPDTQEWRVTFGSIDNATDHNAISEDIAGGANPTDLASTGFSTSSVSNVPEPATMIVMAAGLPFLLKRRRRRG